jgi:hypothetical protein
MIHTCTDCGLVHDQDANEKPIVGPFDSYTLAMVSKFGGYQNLGDPRASAQFVATAGSGGSGGSFQFVLYIPVEINLRDGFGALQNQSSASTFQLKLTLAASTAIYTTAPTTLAAVQTTIYEDGWWKGNQAGVSATPRRPGARSTGRGDLQRRQRQRSSSRSRRASATRSACTCCSTTTWATAPGRPATPISPTRSS